MKPNLGISERDREAVVDRLNHVLADEHVLYTRLRNFHWNVTGLNFHSMHEMFEEQYKLIIPVGDNIAERARMLGGRAIGTLAEFMDHTHLEEHPGETPGAPGMITQLLSDNETIIRYIRESIVVCGEHHDEGTMDLLVGTMRMHEQMAWMLRSTLQGELLSV